ncbi:10532_t:CDS:2 [Paraglomus brasilianum]|uniref:tRNA N(3)-methylcytidine methyltransferase n=1 Tax=Paraglomus brasilianum TaxID=144538 RepID=A0A9N9BWA0_9GLOM|nr:10532_t:CDS:2 [Paraglomus brasilianum]
MTMLQSENGESICEGNGSDKEKSVSSVQDVREASPAFRTRTLVNADDVFNHNAWDNVEWDEEQEMYALKQIEKQANSPVPAEEQERYMNEPASFWDAFYEKNENKFFKDRHWLKVEFPELHQTILKDAGPKRVVEVGCGAGNTLFPLLAVNQNPDLFIYAYDFSSTAVEVVKNHPKYDAQKSKAFVWDLTSDNIPDCVDAGSIDIVVLIFVFSALQPQQWAKAVENVYKMLKPGGLVLFRGTVNFRKIPLL